MRGPYISLGCDEEGIAATIHLHVNGLDMEITHEQAGTLARDLVWSLAQFAASTAAINQKLLAEAFSK